MANWHPVGSPEEFPENQLVSKTVGGTGVVLLRTAGALKALRDRCPHRFAPLSLGKVVDGVVQCPYHGLRFDLEGACVFNPHGDGSIPPQAKVTPYPVEERDGQVFVDLD